MYAISFDDLITELKDPTLINHSTSSSSSAVINRSSLIDKPSIIAPTSTLSRNVISSTQDSRGTEEREGEEDKDGHHDHQKMTGMWGMSTPVMETLPYLNQDPIGGSSSFTPTLITSSDVARIHPTQSSSGVKLTPSSSSSSSSEYRQGMISSSDELSSSTNVQSGKLRLSKDDNSTPVLHHSHHIHHYHLAEGRLSNNQSAGGQSDVRNTSSAGHEGSVHPGHHGSHHPGHHGSHHPHDDAHHNFGDESTKNQTDEKIRKNVETIKNDEKVINNSTPKTKVFSLDDFIEDGKVIIPNKDTSDFKLDDGIINYNNSSGNHHHQFNFSPSSKHDNDGSSKQRSSTTPTELEGTKVPGIIPSDKPTASDRETKEKGIVTTPSRSEDGFHHDEDHHHVPSTSSGTSSSGTSSSSTSSSPFPPRTTVPSRLPLSPVTKASSGTHKPGSSPSGQVPFVPTSPLTPDPTKKSVSTISPLLVNGSSTNFPSDGHNHSGHNGHYLTHGNHSRNGSFDNLIKNAFFTPSGQLNWISISGFASLFLFIIIILLIGLLLIARKNRRLRRQLAANSMSRDLIINTLSTNQSKGTLIPPSTAFNWRRIDGEYSGTNREYSGTNGEYSGTNREYSGRELPESLGLGYRDLHVVRSRDRLGSNTSKSSATKSTMSTSKSSATKSTMSTCKSSATKSTMSTCKSSSSSKVCKKSEFEYVSFTHNKNDECIFKGSTIESRTSDSGQFSGDFGSEYTRHGYVHSIPLTPTEPNPNHTVIQLQRREEIESQGTGQRYSGTTHSGISGHHDTSSGHRPVPKARMSKVQQQAEKTTLEMIKEKVVQLPGVIYTNGT